MIVISLKMTIHACFFSAPEQEEQPGILSERAIVPEVRIPHTQSEKQPTKTVLTDNASLHLLLHCALQLCQGHVQLGSVHVI